MTSNMFLTLKYKAIQIICANKITKAILSNIVLQNKVKYLNLYSHESHRKSSACKNSHLVS